MKSFLKGWDEDKLAYRVLRICGNLEGDDIKIVRQLWADRQYLALRLKILAESLENDNNPREELVEWAKWAGEALEEVL